MINIPPIVALEIGTSTVRAVIGESRDDGHLMITGLGECASCGVRKGEVVDFDNALACVKKALQLAEDNGQIIINEVHLVVTGGHIASMVNRGSVPVMNPRREITPKEIEHVMTTARGVSLPPDRHVLHTICQHFRVDDQDGVIHPEGMEGSTLSLDMLVVHGLLARLRNLAKVVRSADVDIQDVAFGGLCAALAVLTPEEKEAGVAMVDLGGGTTDYVVYANNAIALAGALAVGGDHVTNDVAYGLHVSTTEAEQIKESLGSAVVEMAARSQKVSMASEAGGLARAIKLQDLHTIIHVRMEETFELLKKRWAEAGLLRSLGGGVVLTGGGARMKNIVKLAERVFGLPCRVGVPRGLAGLAVVTEGPQYAASVGMVRYGFRTAAQEDAGGGILGALKKIIGKR